MLTNVISELVRTLSQPLKTSPGLLVLKKSSKSGLAVASITAPATDASLNKYLLCVFLFQKVANGMKPNKSKKILA